MSMRRKAGEKQADLWIPTTELSKSPGHPFYKRLNEVLGKHGFDEYVEALCEEHYASGGRPSIAPGNYFRMLFIGYFEGISSERGIEWRCADSLSLREFLGLDLSGRVPDHSSLSRIRNRLPLGVHIEVFGWVIKVLGEEKLLRGRNLGVDATSLEANAAMRSIVRRDSGQSYEKFLGDLARSAGIEEPSRQDIAKIDRNRKGKGSNSEWKSPVDPDSGIMKMKDGRTHLAHKVEHAVDLETEAVLAVQVRPGPTGDTITGVESAELAMVALQEAQGPGAAPNFVADRGYHSNKVLSELEEVGLRSYVAEPNRGRRKWKGKEQDRDRVYANRRRMRGRRGKELMRWRAERVERAFQHCYGRGDLRRCHLRGNEKITKRLLVHVGAHNLGILMRKLLGAATPRQLAVLRGTLGRAISTLRSIWAACGGVLGVYANLQTRTSTWRPHPIPSFFVHAKPVFSTGC